MRRALAGAQAELLIMAETWPLLAAEWEAFARKKSRHRGPARSVRERSTVRTMPAHWG